MKLQKEVTTFFLPTAGTCQQGLVLCRSYHRAWQRSLEGSKQVTGWNWAEIKCLFQGVLFFFFFFFSCSWYLKCLGSFFFFFFNNLLPVLYIQKHCALYGFPAHMQALFMSLPATVPMPWYLLSQTYLTTVKEEQLNNRANSPVCILKCFAKDPLNHSVRSPFSLEVRNLEM